MCSDSRTGWCIPRAKSKKSKPKKSRVRSQKSADDKLKGQQTKRILNPAFLNLNLENPIAQHIFLDKIGDAKRSSNIFQGVTVATAYPLGPVRAIGPQGWVLATLITIGISIPIIGYAQTADQYRDLAQFAQSGEIHGHKLFGETHNI
tara:strand:- start:175 stop:618 length:444 start_codon:yes stop_codon:yes gene_type:complete